MDDGLTAPPRARGSAVRGSIGILLAVAAVIAAQQFLYFPTLRRWQCGVPFPETPAWAVWAIGLTSAAVVLWSLATASRPPAAPPRVITAGLIVIGIAAALTLAVVAYLTPPPVDFQPAVEGCTVDRVSAFAIGLLLLTPLVALAATHVISRLSALPRVAMIVLTAAVAVAVWVPFVAVVLPFSAG